MIDKNSPIGVFDSGLGGISVLKQLKELMPNENFIYYGDSKFAPYGTKDKQEIINRCLNICDFFIQRSVKAILIACNTATSVGAETLRSTYSIPIIGMEPALKVAAHNKENQNIIVMATPLTLKESKFENLMNEYAKNNTIIKMPCPELVRLVENDELGDTSKIMSQLHTYYKDIDINKIDSIVLGCTHFVFYRKFFNAHLKHINIIDGNLGTITHLKNVLKDNNMLNDLNNGSIKIYNSFEEEHYIALSNQLMKGD